MNKLEKLQEATILALQGKLQEAKSLGVKAGGIEVITGSGDQMGNVAPLLLEKDNKYIWVFKFASYPSAPNPGCLDR